MDGNEVSSHEVDNHTSRDMSDRLSAAFSRTCDVLAPWPSPAHLLLLRHRRLMFKSSMTIGTQGDARSYSVLTTRAAVGLSGSTDHFEIPPVVTGAHQ